MKSEPESTNKEPEKQSLSLMKMLPLLVIIAVLLISAIFFRDLVSIDTLQENREFLTQWRDNHYILAALIFVGLYVIVVSFSLPFALPMTLTGGFLFGTIIGSFLTVTGATLGASILFIAAKTGLADALRSRVGPWMQKFESGIQENEISYLFLLRLVPAFPFFVANLLPAFFGVSLWRFAWTTFLGIIPGTFAFASAGAGIGEVFDRGEKFSFSLFADPTIYGPILALIVVALLPVVIKTIRGKSAKGTENE